MAFITQIKPQKNQRRVNIYLDDEFGFGLDLENYMKLSLKVGNELTDEQVEEIVKKAEFQKTLDKLLRFATLRPRSVREYNLWFKKRKVHDSLHEMLFNRLKKLELLDDEKFTRWWVGQRLQFKYKSRREIAYELRQKGIDKEIIDQVISESVDQEKEIEMAKKLLEKKIYRWKSLPKIEAQRKMSDYLGRHGFGWDVVKEAINEK